MIDWTVRVPPMQAELATAAAAADGFLPADEGRALYTAAVRACAVGPLLEVGTWCGKSAIHLVAAARTALGRDIGSHGVGSCDVGSRGVGSRVVTIDHHRGSEEHQPGWEYHDPTLWDDHVDRLDTLGRLRHTLADAGIEDDLVVVVGRSVDVAALWGHPLGLVFIDGGHTEQAAQSDYTSWAPHVAPGGLLVIHDVFEDPADGGRAPFHMWQRAIMSGAFAPRPEAGCRSLRVLQRRATGDPLT